MRKVRRVAVRTWPPWQWGTFDVFVELPRVGHREWAGCGILSCVENMVRPSRVVHYLIVLVVCTRWAQAEDVLPLMDAALAATAAVVKAGGLSATEEIAAVQRIMQGEPGMLLLAKHFAGASTFGVHMRTAVSGVGMNTATAAAPLPPSPPPSVGYEPLFARRSVVAYKQQEVPAEVVQRALEAAILAPNHFLTEPWRFYLIGPEARTRLLALNPAKQETFEKVPGWMIVTLVPSELAADGSLSTKKGLEDHVAVACAVQNFMLSLAADGVASKWMTGALGSPPEAVMRAVGADAATEHFMGAIWYGFPEAPLSADAKAPARKKGLEGVLTRTA